MYRCWGSCNWPQGQRRSRMRSARVDDSTKLDSGNRTERATTQIQTLKCRRFWRGSKQWKVKNGKSQPEMNHHRKWKKRNTHRFHYLKDKKKIKNTSCILQWRTIRDAGSGMGRGAASFSLGHSRHRRPGWHPGAATLTSKTSPCRDSPFKPVTLFLFFFELQTLSAVEDTDEQRDKNRHKPAVQNWLLWKPSWDPHVTQFTRLKCTAFFVCLLGCTTITTM